MEKVIPIILTLPDERSAVCDGEAFVLPAGVALPGVLSLRLSDGPHGIREYEHPHYMEATFDFDLVGRQFRYSGLISQWRLWAPDRTAVEKEQPDFRDDSGQIDGMMDVRQEWSYLLPDGTVHTNRLKYTSCQFWLMVQPSSFLVRCRYYDQNPGIAGMVTIFYRRPLEELLLLKDTRYSYNADGTLDDFDLYGGETLTLQPR